MSDVPTCLFIGNRCHGEFAAAVRDLEACLHSRFVETLEQAIALLSDEELEPALLILARIRPGDISARQVDRLRRAAPLARVVELLGVWCDGELRTGEPLVATIRVPCHLWKSWFQREAAGDGNYNTGPEGVRLTSNSLPAWSWPVTASVDERLLANRAAMQRQVGLIAIRGCDADGAAWLTQVCQSVGYTTVTFESAPTTKIVGATAGIWQAGIRHPAHWTDLAAFIAALAPAPVTCVMSFPRPEEIERAISAGASYVLAQPLLIDDLLSALLPASFGVGPMS